jgi:hypothetical protein
MMSTEVRREPLRTLINEIREVDQCDRVVKCFDDIDASEKDEYVDNHILTTIVDVLCQPLISKYYTAAGEAVWHSFVLRTYIRTDRGENRTIQAGTIIGSYREYVEYDAVIDGYQYTASSPGMAMLRAYHRMIKRGQP